MVLLNKKKSRQEATQTHNYFNISHRKCQVLLERTKEDVRMFKLQK